jgi:hypothetical protein
MRAAQDRWVRVNANMDAGGYDLMYAEGNLPDPKWPDMTWGDILMRAFKGRVIDSLDHPVCRKLRGEI